MSLNNQIEIYDNAIEATVCDKLISMFDESNATHQSTTSGNVMTEVRNTQDLIVSFAQSGQELSRREANSDVQELLDSTWEYVVKYMNKHFLPNSGNHFWKHFLSTQNLTEFNTDIVKRLIEKEETICMISKSTKDKGHTYAWHEDSAGKLTDRFITVMSYLNDVEEGGETEWYYQKLKVKPKKGTTVIFPPYYTHLHRGNIPLSNDKYIVTFFLNRPGSKSDRLL
tara:strand:- start:2066 stop:2743 length:678 start_codon:yes stop_codon:yes gene_type:complete